MSMMVSELFDALRKAGVDEALARAAATAVLSADFKADLATKADIERLKLATKADFERLELATKADIDRLELATKANIERLEARLEARIAETKADIIKWNVGPLAIMTAIFAAIVRLG